MSGRFQVRLRWTWTTEGSAKCRPDNSVFSLSWNILQIAAAAFVLLTLFPLYAHFCPASRGPTLTPIVELSRRVRRRKDPGDFRGLDLVNHIRRLGHRLHGCCHQLLFYCQSENNCTVIVSARTRTESETRRNVAPATLNRTSCQIKLHVRTVFKRSLTHQQDPENAQKSLLHDGVDGFDRHAANHLRQSPSLCLRCRHVHRYRRSSSNSLVGLAVAAEAASSTVISVVVLWGPPTPQPR